MQSRQTLNVSEKNDNSQETNIESKIIQSHGPLDEVEIKKQDNEEVEKQDAIREQLINQIEYGLEYVFETIGSNERITLPLIKYKSGDVYGGEWKNGVRDGKGRLEQPDGRIFVGDWENDRATGWGKLIYQDGDIYEGEWKMNHWNGKGTYTYYGSEMKYQGEWQGVLKHGKGVEKWEDGAKLECEYFQDQKHGEGIMQYENGEIYEGQFQQNYICGYGIYDWQDGRNYKGEWKNDRMFGKGQNIWRQKGQKYTGEYVNEEKHGKGVFEWKGGKKYIGSWIQGKQHGIAIYCSQNNTACVEIMIKGKKILQIQQLLEFDYDTLLNKASEIIQNLQQKLFDITLKEEDQIQFKCHDNNNQRIQLPPIKLIKLASGAIYEGEWKNAMKDGQGKIVFPDGSLYQGQWKNNLMHGWGRHISKDGKVFEGEWLDNLPVQEEKSTQEIHNNDTSIFYELLI